METKVCSKCNSEKSVERYSNHIRTKDGLRHACKECDAQYRKDNSKQRVQASKEYWEKHPERHKEYLAEWRFKHKEKLAAKTRERYAKTGYVYKDRKVYFRKNYDEKKDVINARKKAWRDNNKEKVAEMSKKSWEKNKGAISLKNKERWANDPVYRKKSQIRSAIYKSIVRKGYDKKGKTESILGCDYDFFIQYIEAQFTEGMDWSNATIDHIKPMKTATTTEQVIILNHYTNLQPLFQPDNSSKKAKLITKQLRLI